MTPQDVSSDFTTPKDLAAAIGVGDVKARQAIRTLFLDVLIRLAERIRVEFDRDYDSRQIAERLLRVIELRIRFRLAPETLDLNWSAFRRAIVLDVAKALVQPFGEKLASSAYTPTLPQSEQYAAHVLLRPLDPLGDHYFGGDWVGVREASDGGLWFFLADVMGHGYEAYVLATALPDIWSICTERGATDLPPPTRLLLDLHHLVADFFPDGAFVEAVIGKLAPSGDIMVAPGGGVRVVTRTSRTRHVQLHRVRGSLLGIMPPDPEDECLFQLDGGDEIAFASDGLFDQLEGYGDHTHSTQQQLASGGAETLWPLLTRLLRKSLSDYPQRDDITAIAFVRRSPGENGGDLPA